MSRSKKRKMIINGILVILFLLILCLFFWGLRSWENKRGSEICKKNSHVISYKGTMYDRKSGLESILILGLDKYEEDEVFRENYNNQQADFILLMVIDHGTQSYEALHLNRDTMTNMDIVGRNSEKLRTVHQQLALAHTYGEDENSSCCFMRRTISDLLHDVRIDHYASITLDTVGIFNDLLGGVELTLMDDFSDLNPEFTEGAQVTLNGEQALTYVRARGGMQDKTNLHRMERQRQYMLSANEQMREMTEQDPEFVQTMVVELFPYVTSDMTANQVAVMLEKIKGYTFEGFRMIDGEMVRGEKFMEYNLDEDSLMQNILDLFYIPVREQ